VPASLFLYYGLLQITQSLAAPSANTQSFDATIEVNGSTSVLGKSNLLLQGPASHFFPLVFAAHV
jgi:hypothetical protein